jgi:hypothetical protein
MPDVVLFDATEVKTEDLVVWPGGNFDVKDNNAVDIDCSIEWPGVVSDEEDGFNDGPADVFSAKLNKWYCWSK